jgi:hypothetical protein
LKAKFTGSYPNLKEEVEEERYERFMKALRAIKAPMP